MTIVIEFLVQIVVPISYQGGRLASTACVGPESQLSISLGGPPCGAFVLRNSRMGTPTGAA
jgi:hypothetical protein